METNVENQTAFETAKNILLEELDSLIQTCYIKTMLSEEDTEFFSLGDAETVPHDEELYQLLSLLTDIRFQLDPHLLKSMVEVQDYFDEFIKLSERHYRLRALLDLTNVLYIRLGVSQWQTLMTELARTMSLHSNINKHRTCYDEMITNNIWGEDIGIFSANPWLVTTCLIKLLPPSEIIKYLDPNSYLGNASEATK